MIDKIPEKIRKKIDEDNTGYKGRFLPVTVAPSFGVDLELAL